MADLMSSSLPYLTAAMGGNLSQSVTYLRGSRAVGSSLTATYGLRPAQRRNEQDAEYGVVTWENRDFIFTAADLTLDSEQITPLPKDTITDAAGETFIVLGDGDNETCFEWADPYHTQIRVHARRER
jgi:hypothetical protein